MSKRRKRKPLPLEQLVGRLGEVHGPVRLPRRLDPLSELVFTVLSQNTSDRNSEAAYQSLTLRFPDWDQVRRARVKSIANTIRHGGLADQKAPRIKQILKQIHAEQGTLSLDHLDEMTDDEAVEYLVAFDGVGRKTAACVLLFACRRPVLPVDTHVHRVSQRLGLIGPKTTADQAHDLLQAELPDALVLDFHVQLIRHGRTTCKAQRPRCESCVLRESCPAEPQLATMAANKKRAPQSGGAILPHVPPAR